MNEEETQADGRIDEAAAALRAGTFEQALELLEHALRLHPASPKAWNLVGAVCQQLGKLPEARAAHEQAYRSDPSNPEHLVNVASIALKQGDPETARQCLVLALEMEPRLVAAHVNLALTWAVFGRLEDAEGELRLAVLYGYDEPGPIQDRIDKLRSIREDIIRRHGDPAGAAPDGFHDDAQATAQAAARKQEAARLLEALERERESCAAAVQREMSTAVDHAARDDDAAAEHAERLRLLDRQIEALKELLATRDM